MPFRTSEASASLPMKGFAMAASKPIFVRWSTATALVVSMSFSLMSAIDCSPKEWASLFICEISDADSGRIIWKFILTAQTWCSTAQMILVCKLWQPLIGRWSGIEGKNYWALFFYSRSGNPFEKGSSHRSLPGGDPLSALSP